MADCISCCSSPSAGTPLLWLAVRAPRSPHFHHVLDQSSKPQLSPGWTNPVLACKLFQLCCSLSPKTSFYTQSGWLWLSFTSSHCLWHFCACQVPALPRFPFLCQLPGRCIQEKSSSPSGLLQPCSSWLFLPAHRDKVQLWDSHEPGWHPALSGSLYSSCSSHPPTLPGLGLQGAPVAGCTSAGISAAGG